jgi:hypothetical protein
MLVASATALPLLLAASGCRSADAFDGPDPLAGRPSPGHDVVVLQAAISAEEALISLYVTATATATAKEGSKLLASLLAQHRQHLARLRAALVLPPGPATASPSVTASAGATASPGATTSAGGGAGGKGAGGEGAGGEGAGGKGAGGKGAGVVARLRAAERASAAAGLRRLATVDPSLAQLLASIAACDATHVAALAALA